MSSCQLDSRHRPEWCEYHFAEQQRSKEIQLQKEQNMLLREQNDLLRQQESNGEHRKPYIPYNRSPAPKTPLEPQKPQIRGTSL
jgi:hypothetical protein